MYAVVRRYENERDGVADEARRHEAALQQTMRGIDGLVGYYLIDTADGGLATVSVFADQSGAEESTRAAAKFVGENMPDWMPNPPTVLMGEVAVSATP